MPDKIATIEQHGAVTSIYTNLQSNTELWTLNVADVHFDSVYCNRELMRSQFDEAARRNARINIYGDWFDAMQGRYDKRREYPLLRKEYKREDYYDFVVKDSVEWLKNLRASIGYLCRWKPRVVGVETRQYQFDGSPGIWPAYRDGELHCCPRRVWRLGSLYVQPGAGAEKWNAEGYQGEILPRRRW